MDILTASAPTMRTYAPIWSRLKKEMKVSVTANRVLHGRIIKAVIKEKWSDLGYKILIEPKIAVLGYKINHSVITFTLTITANSMSAKELEL